mmetsp:Transcript_15036/g.54218  ORF Transcript_15036/g.54218 Transcript_15036/m.54218 type:complete len:284 (-) Transcript_15036:1256-2107(-)
MHGRPLPPHLLRVHGGHGDRGIHRLHRGRPQPARLRHRLLRVPVRHEGVENVDVRRRRERGAGLLYEEVPALVQGAGLRTEHGVGAVGVRRVVSRRDHHHRGVHLAHAVLADVHVPVLYQEQRGRHAQRRRGLGRELLREARVGAADDVEQRGGAVLSQLFRVHADPESMRPGALRRDVHRARDIFTERVWWFLRIVGLHSEGAHQRARHRKRRRQRLHRRRVQGVDGDRRVRLRVRPRLLVLVDHVHSVLRRGHGVDDHLLYQRDPVARDAFLRDARRPHRL